MSAYRLSINKIQKLVCSNIIVSCLLLNGLPNTKVWHGARGLPFTGTGCSISDAINIYLIRMSTVWATVSTFFHLPGMSLSTDVLLEKPIGLVTMDLLYLYTNLWSFSGLVTDSPCGVWGHGWATRLLSVRWTNFRFIFLNDSWCVSLTQ